MTFLDKLCQAQETNRSWLCVGLDPAPDRLPPPPPATDPLLHFARAIIEATADLVCAYKPNLAFWLAEGAEGLRQLALTIAAIPDPIPVILDAKFNDIGHTAAAYARAAFETLSADGVTANPYLGLDGLRPFLTSADHGLFLLARTSNPSAPDLQDRPVEGRPLYQVVAHLATAWNAETPGACGLVVGATYPDELRSLRQTAPDLPFLIPGIGAQGGSLEAAVAYGPTRSPTQGERGREIGPVINVSRAILYASDGADFATAARDASLTLRERINHVREEQV